MYAPNYERDDAQSSYLLVADQFAESRFNRQPTATIFGMPHGSSLPEAAARDFHLTIHAALDELIQDVASAHQDSWW